jgi:CheY-like chemotaxis protein
MILQAAVHSPVPVICSHCNQEFDARTAAVCDCVFEHRSLQCGQCGQCWCADPLETRRQQYAHLTPEIHQRIRASKNSDSRLNSVTLKRPLVVLADDNVDIRYITRRHLEAAGYGVIAVADGEQAWAATLEYRPDIVLTDGLMPALGGQDLARRIKDAKETAMIPVVLMTSLYTSVAQKQEAFQIFGIDAFLAKPIRPQALLETLQHLAPTP